MADNISNELQLITSQLSEKLAKLESEFQRWTDYKTDYDALEVQLKTLPETTSKSAMVRTSERTNEHFSTTLTFFFYVYAYRFLLEN